MYAQDASTANTSTNATVNSCPAYQETPASQLCKTLAYAIIILLSLVGNTVVVVAVYKSPRMRTVTNLFICNLAVSDLLITVLGMPNMITQLYLKDRWVFGAVLCKVVVFCQSASVASSVLTLLAVTWDRFWSIVFPLRPRMTKTIAKGIMCGIWITSCATMAPFLYAQRVIVGDGGYDICLETWEPLFDGEQTAKDYTVVLFIMLYLVPLLAMCAFYSVILNKLWRRKVPGNHSQLNAQKSRHSKKKVVRMLMTVTLLFAVCWLPLYVYQFLVFFARIRCFDSDYVFYFVSLFLGHANSAVNPFLYSLFQKRYRYEFTAVLLCHYKRNYFVRYSNDRVSYTRSARFPSSWARQSGGSKRLSARDDKQPKAETVRLNPPPEPNEPGVAQEGGSASPYRDGAPQDVGSVTQDTDCVVNDRATVAGDGDSVSRDGQV